MMMRYMDEYEASFSIIWTLVWKRKDDTASVDGNIYLASGDRI